MLAIPLGPGGRKNKSFMMARSRKFTGPPLLLRSSRGSVLKKPARMIERSGKVVRQLLSKSASHRLPIPSESASIWFGVLYSAAVIGNVNDAVLVTVGVECFAGVIKQVLYLAGVERVIVKLDFVDKAVEKTCRLVANRETADDKRS